MPLIVNNVLAELSYAYLHAVAARAGFGCEVAGRHSDDAGVDAYLRIREKLSDSAIHRNFAMEVQLKATSLPPNLERERYHYRLTGIDRYNVLRERSAPFPKILIVLFLPRDSERWLEHSEEFLLTRRCAYWTSLWDAPESKNSSGITIYLPRVNVLSVAGLRTLATRLACDEELTYGG